ncbi:protein GRINL1A [Trichomycterus rosablanca]|uniref:protein GRINL1A n=1 Tax=Trichomycterus rosablanca TaxID=2290929 RepID=UPI002F35FCBD
MEGQGLLGDLNSKSKEELCDILNRQEKILQNKRFIQTLPDKGKKIFDFVEKVRHALAIKEEDEKTQASLASVRAEFQSRYQQALTRRQHIASNIKHVSGSTRKKDADSVVDVNAVGSGSVGVQNPETEESSCSDATASGSADTSKDDDLVKRLERITLSKDTSTDAVKNLPTENPFQGTLHHKKPHYIEVLSKSEECVQKHRFKPNQLPMKSASPSPVQSPGRDSPLSVEARRQRDRKHLDDITAAKLPPLHHKPAQLLSLEESVTLQQEQTKKYQELQAKLAAQKLTEGLAIGMSSYSPDGGAQAAYREVHDDGELSEED